MSQEMRPYVVRQGDYLVKLAFVHGFDAEEVWNDAKNDEIRERRGDHNILAPGDIVYLPVKAKEALPIVKGTTNKYTAKVPKVPLRLFFRTGFTRLANSRYMIEGDASPNEGFTDAEGLLELSVSVDATELCVVFPDLDQHFELFVGHMDPVSEPSGVRARLTHLGYLLRPSAEYVGITEQDTIEVDDDVWLTSALRAFQKNQSLLVTGVADEETCLALIKAHGS